MPRKGPTTRRRLVADPVHHSALVTQIVNKVMLRGKRGLAERIVYDAMELISARTGEDSLTLVKRAVDNVKPPLEVKSRRVGGATYQVPMEVRSPRNNTWPSAGSSTSPGRAVRRRWRSALPPS